jgi:hypothetical protein
MSVLRGIIVRKLGQISGLKKGNRLARPQKKGAAPATPSYILSV